MQKEDLIYLAGAVDCDGTITLTRSNWERQSPHILPLVMVSNTDEGLMQWLEHTFGASYNREGDQFGWRCTGKAAVALLRKLLPLLKIKQRQAFHILEYVEHYEPSPNSRPVSQEQAALRRGFWFVLRYLNSRPGRRGRRYEIPAYA